jgi:hypothetical protein
MSKVRKKQSIKNCLICLQADHRPNKKTLKVIADVQAGKGLIKVENAEDLFRNLGI